MDAQDYAEILEENGWTRAQLLARADCVIHLVTAADGRSCRGIVLLKFIMFIFLFFFLKKNGSVVV